MLRLAVADPNIASLPEFLTPVDLSSKIFIDTQGHSYFMMGPNLLQRSRVTYFDLQAMGSMEMAMWTLGISNIGLAEDFILTNPNIGTHYLISNDKGEIVRRSSLTTPGSVFLYNISKRTIHPARFHKKGFFTLDGVKLLPGFGMKSGPFDRSQPPSLPETLFDALASSRGKGMVLRHHHHYLVVLDSGSTPSGGTYFYLNYFTGDAKTLKSLSEMLHTMEGEETTLTQIPDPIPHENNIILVIDPQLMTVKRYLQTGQELPLKVKLPGESDSFYLNTLWQTVTTLDTI
jgi:hypothetical protein